MLNSAKDVNVEGGKFLGVAGDYVYHEHHYQNPEIVFNNFNFYPSAEDSRPEGSNYSVFDRDQPEYLKDDGTTAVYEFLGQIVEDQDPPMKHQRMIEEHPSVAVREAHRPQHRRPAMQPPAPGLRSYLDGGDTLSPLETIYLTGLVYVEHSVTESNASSDGQTEEYRTGPDDTPFPLALNVSSCTSSDFARYDELYQNTPYWGGTPEPNFNPLPSYLNYVSH